MYGVVLSRRDFREADQIITILTAEEGKHEYIARGVKKIVSKNTSHIEPSSLVSFGIAEGKKEWSYLTNVQPVESFFYILQSLSTIHMLGYSLDAMLTMLRDGEADSEMYHFFISFLRFLDTHASSVRLILLDAFLIKLFSHLGYHPSLDACVVCEKTYTDIGKEFLSFSDKKPSFYFAGGGILCASCTIEKQRIGESMYPCGIKEINTLRLLVASSWQDVFSFSIDEEEYRLVHKLVYEFMLYHSERTWADWKQIQTV
ncbi:MAG: DNA repair protein RecO [Candidatus Magasanikbacteria bacterium CG10_big_fil_rev_8_21_14_0_10_42_10]|uniref:DNA repair protein RecO n=2 Tax=Candidatus Magasanikiibacteriota TaxID=1752731 RepID=A0A2H0TVA0_9BACT|nr:MAG: DNA repair protein RecO [Candidatus Magasanikbacteria bacterium CG10_big_fil_rev_8_21_14_0_10_42_10]PIZ94281.1 MAG: DNA repair protein RecO [Candidatus Magasanikbacteria bacterium CG_4_10_14_0_2_um_filter_41_10]